MWIFASYVWTSQRKRDVQLVAKMGHKLVNYVRFVNLLHGSLIEMQWNNMALHKKGNRMDNSIGLRWWWCCQLMQIIYRKATSPINHTLWTLLKIELKGRLKLWNRNMIMIIIIIKCSRSLPPHPILEASLQWDNKTHNITQTWDRVHVRNDSLRFDEP